MQMSWFSRSAFPRVHVERPKGRVGAVLVCRVTALIATVLLSVSCGSQPAGSDVASSPTPSPDVFTSPLVGTWARETTCEEVISVLTDAGFEQWILDAVAGNGFVPGVRDPDQITDPDHPCRRAVPREHSHFFTEDGQFGSLDWKGQPVDDGTYELVDEDTFVVSKEFPEDVTFHFTVEGDTIAFEPVIPECAPDCFEAVWSVMVAYPGEEWHRVSE
jgi:hypothetical protein